MNALSVRTQREMLAVEPDLNQRMKRVHLASRAACEVCLFRRKFKMKEGSMCAHCLCVYRAIIKRFRKHSVFGENHNFYKLL